MATCDVCNGLKVCTLCKGRGGGKRHNPHPSKGLVDSDTGKVKCLQCNDDLKCVQCNGTGKR